ncbi:hypothetical protein [Streptomyces swartbergensis]|uniref:hypothetical protein n=1 Tax=Streptomyces swartbergensis TaxID=487165 RepID=UPI0026BBA1BF
MAFDLPAGVSASGGDGYRHPRNQGRPGLMPAVLEAFSRPRPLIEGAEAAGDPIEVLPAVFHALWHHTLTTALKAPLHERVIVSPGPLREGSGAGRGEESQGCVPAAECPASGEGRGGACAGYGEAV